MPTLSRRDFVGASLALLASPGFGQEAGDRLEVHEWGVLTVPDGATFAAARTAGSTFDARRAELASNPPDFVATWSKTVGDRIEKWKSEPRVVFKPVVYFYSRRRTTLTLQVGVPAGRPAVWWPPASELAPVAKLPPHSGHLAELDPEPPKVEEIAPENGLLLWKDLVVDPASTPSRVVPDNHWWATARRVDASPVAIGGECDRFVFYDALTGARSPVAVEWTGDDAVTVRNLLPRELPFIVAVRVQDGKPRLAAAGPIAPRASLALTLDSDDPSGLAARLKAQGLFEKEAAGMTSIWTPEFFAADGFRVLASLPSADIESLLPMTIAPPPAKLVRVLLVQVECLGPDGLASVDALIARLGSEDVAERDEASAALVKLGLRAEGSLRRAAAASPDPEVRGRCVELLRAIGVKP